MFFKILILQILAKFFYKLFNFFKLILTFNVNIQVFERFFLVFLAPGAQGPPPRFDNKLLHSF